MGGTKILVDPILVGNLDFGIPWLYDAAKKFIKNYKVLLIRNYLGFMQIGDDMLVCC